MPASQHYLHRIVTSKNKNLKIILSQICKSSPHLKHSFFSPHSRNIGDGLTATVTESTFHELILSHCCVNCSGTFFRAAIVAFFLFEPIFLVYNWSSRFCCTKSCYFFIFNGSLLQILSHSYVFFELTPFLSVEHTSGYHVIHCC